MSAEDLLRIGGNFYLFIIVPLLLGFVGAASAAVVTGLRRRQLPGLVLGFLVAVSLCAVAFGGVVTLASGGASLQTLTCQSESTDYVCTDRGQLAAILTLMLGTPVLGLSALLLAWLPKREPPILRLVGAVAALAAPLLPIWVVFGSPLFRVES